ncbi:unnamed protein product [Sphagnum troendelagicum]|uniref:HAT C-terminal dimerisation domain-containing protein n=1 Tax=Sphagnum troendelagicum TaxID=128251 RepID=A0ABP0U5P2_9BRYO
MQTFVIVDVYVMLYSLYTTVLDVSKPLELIIPVRRQLGSEDPYPMLRSHDLLQPATREARKYLGKAMSERYFKRYHPILALHQPKKIYGNNLGRPMLQKTSLEETDFKFSYLIDAQSMLYLPMTSGKILVKLINATNIDRLDIPVGWTQESLQKQHFVFVNQFIWNKIRCLAKTVAAPIVLKKQQMAMGGSTPAGRLERPAKRVKTLELLSAALDIVAEDDKKDVNGSGECFETAAQMVNAEIQILKGIGDETNMELWPESTELCKWWARQTSMPCLMQAALAILANKPSSGGLECDLGSLSDVLAPKRSSLRAGLVEINMFLKINKHLIPTNPTEVVLLDKKMNLSWENNIPKRPVMALYDGGEEEEKEEKDNHDDNDNSPV